MPNAASPQRLSNFGANLQFQPGLLVQPRTEEELLSVLRENQGKRCRAIGRLHSWSEVVVGDEIVVDTRNLQHVIVHDEGEQSWAEVGAGCQIKHLLVELERQGGFTVPALGLITEQTVAGAAATGTHGSGRHSLSHYLQAVRLIATDPVTGEFTVRTIRDGDELRAARCSLGCLGIVTAVQLPIRQQYQVEEFFRRYKTLQEVLQQEAAYPLQQFFLVPWRWDFYAQHRREVPDRRSATAWLYRLFWAVGMDVAFHLIILMLARLCPRRVTKWFYRWMIPVLIPQGWRVVDRSDRQLTMEHELFRHIEIELFVGSRQLEPAMHYVCWLLRYLGGERAALDEALQNQLQKSGHWAELEAAAGSYLHHYPVCIRKVLADDTLLSMASGPEEAYYAISFISYAQPNQRDGFFQFASIAATTMAELFGARPHWGKYCPLDPATIRTLYPKLDQFADICDRSGSAALFRNQWLDKLFGQRNR